MLPSLCFPRRLAVAAGLGVVALSLALTSGTTVRACDTPVYRYAMYNWVPEPYRIFYFYRGEVPAEDQKINETLSELAQRETAPVNVLLFPINVSQEEAYQAQQLALSMSGLPIDVTRSSPLGPIPQVVIDAWKTYDNGAAPAHVVMNPRGGKVFAGRLDPDTLQAMVASPARKRIAELFDQGHGIVWILLEGPKKAENARAEKLIKKIIADAAAGKVAPPMDSGPPMPPPGEDADSQPGDEEAARKANGLDVGLVKLARNDPAEKWLVHSLMTVEPDLNEYAEETMVFAVFGRGVALPPCLGEGINEQNLVGDLQFLSGPCSCTIKYQNPGVDLLLGWDWNATADKMAKASGDFDDDSMYEEFSPLAVDSLVPSTPEGNSEDVVGSEPAQPGGSAEQPDPSTEMVVADASNGGPAEPERPDAQSPADTEAGPQAWASQGPDDASGVANRSDGPGKPGHGQAGVAAPGPPSAPGQQSDKADAPASDEGSSFASRQAWKLGVGIGLAAVVLFVAGLVLFRRASGGY